MVNSSGFSLAMSYNNSKYPEKFVLLGGGGYYFLVWHSSVQSCIIYLVFLLQQICCIHQAHPPQNFSTIFCDIWEPNLCPVRIFGSQICMQKCRKSRYFCGRILARILCSRKVYEVLHVCILVDVLDMESMCSN